MEIVIFVAHDLFVRKDHVIGGGNQIIFKLHFVVLSERLPNVQVRICGRDKLARLARLWGLS